ncbi:MAG: bifunctional hydroxymethylpyrimidine kinase/phosphomethylpyrimidine kinase, partial [Solobacterium sp.]|nr:bifunctional hydroxymethylpyrimidine kinase/phosphomethylpyrimidine kinase [Solobacterium sp.]
IIVDAGGSVLKTVLPYHPYLIKPNQQELSEIFGANVLENQIEEYACKLVSMGAQNVLVSLGNQGALLVNHKVYRCHAPNGEVINSVGAGDSMVAAFLTSKLNGEDDQTALEKSVAMGSATAFSYGIADQEAVDVLYKEMVK